MIKATNFTQPTGPATSDPPLPRVVWRNGQTAQKTRQISFQILTHCLGNTFIRARGYDIYISLVMNILPETTGCHRSLQPPSLHFFEPLWRSVSQLVERTRRSLKKKHRSGYPLSVHLTFQEVAHPNILNIILPHRVYCTSSCIVHFNACLHLHYVIV